MAKSTKVGGKGSRKHGRNKEKCKRYLAHKRREKNKLKRILQSNGLKAAELYAKENGLKNPVVS